ncbi:ATP-binding protein [Streptomyces sp. NPDC003327]
MTETTTGRRTGTVVRRYDGGDGTIAAARDATAAFLPRTEEGLDRDAALLVVSELVTNAVVHAPGPLVLELALCGDFLEIAVSDTYGVRPVERPRDPERVGGHGVEIVAALCERVTTEPTATGKRVTARLRLR